MIGWVCLTTIEYKCRILRLGRSDEERAGKLEEAEEEQEYREQHVRELLDKECWDLPKYI